MGEKTTCVVVGGGPAGMVLGLLLSRAGVEVTVLEKHADFLRDFRGDTVHPATLRLIDELGLWPQFSALPQSRLRNAAVEVSPGHSVTVVDFERLRQPHPYIAMVPQWDLLNLLAQAGAAEPGFTLRMSTEVTALLRDGGRVTGVRYQSADGPGELRADLTIGCDGRSSVVRRDAGLQVREWPVSFDVWWFRLPRPDDANYTLFPRVAPSKAMIVIPREGYLQIAMLIPKGSDARQRARGLDAFHADVLELLPEAGDTVETVTTLNDVKHLDVRLNRLRRWHTPGLLCIGDAAHAMSPVGGVGINMAVQDGVAAARLLAEPLRRGRVTQRDLAAVQHRRNVPTAVTQTFQRQLDRRLLGPILRGGSATGPPPALVRLLELAPWASVIPGYLIGVGVRPERAPTFARRTPPVP